MQKTSLLVGVVSFTVIVLFPCQAYQLTGPNQNVDNKMGEVFWCCRLAYLCKTQVNVCLELQRSRSFLGRTTNYSILLYFFCQRAKIVTNVKVRGFIHLNRYLKTAAPGKIFSKDPAHIQ